MSNQALTPIEVTFICTEAEHGMRLDQALAIACPDYSRSRLQSWIKSDKVTIDGEVVNKQRTPVHNGQTLRLQATPTLSVQESWQAPQDIPLNILYHDDDIIVINKPAGLVVHPGTGNPDKTLVNALLHFDANLAELPRAGIVHRLDKDTTGVMVVARSLVAHTHLVRQLQERSLKREYQALVRGDIISGGTIDAPIDRHPSNRLKMAVVEHSKREAITHYRVSKRFGNMTLLNVMLETGRTHQIRVHMQHIKHPLIGDPTYAGRLQIPAGLNEAQRTHLLAFRRQALHAKALTLTHPVSGELTTFTAPRPDDLQQLLDVLTDDSQAE